MQHLGRYLSGHAAARQASEVIPGTDELRLGTALRDLSPSGRVTGDPGASPRREGRVIF